MFARFRRADTNADAERYDGFFVGPPRALINMPQRRPRSARIVGSSKKRVDESFGFSELAAQVLETLSDLLGASRIARRRQDRRTSGGGRRGHSAVHSGPRGSDIVSAIDRSDRGRDLGLQSLLGYPVGEHVTDPTFEELRPPAERPGNRLVDRCDHETEREVHEH